MSKHTPEPWAHRNGRIFQADRDVLTIANIARAFDGDYSPENGRRIVACVNACRGLPTDELEQNDLVAAVGTQLLDADARSAEKDWEILRLTHMIDKSVDSRLAKALKQCDELLAALSGASEKMKAAHESMFEQCLSNPVYNAWGKEINLSAINELQLAASRIDSVIAKAKGGEA